MRSAGHGSPTRQLNPAEDTAGGWLDNHQGDEPPPPAYSPGTGDRVVVVSEPADSSAAPSIRTGTFSRKNPFVTTLTRNHQLNGDGSAKGRAQLRLSPPHRTSSLHHRRRPRV